MLAARLRGMALIAALVFAIDTASKLAAHRWLPDYIFNPRPPVLAGEPLLIVACAVAGLLMACPLGVLSAGLVIGGACGNALDSLYGPVLDFIPAPDGWMFNLADAALVGGILLMGAVMTSQVWKLIRPTAARRALTGL